MFSVIFEVTPSPDQWESYLGYARLLRPELIQIDGFIDNVRYASRRRPGRVLSLSTWRDEKALIRWRTQAMHVDAQGKGRLTVFRDYHLRVGQVTGDTHPPMKLREQRLDETETGAGKAVVLIEGTAAPLTEPDGDGLVDWDVFEAILTPGAFLLLHSWRDAQAAIASPVPDGARVRHVRVIRDYGMFDRHEAPQYFPPCGRFIV